MKLFEILDPALVMMESREELPSWNARVRPSEASVELINPEEAKIAGTCHRRVYFRMTGEPSTNKLSVQSARKFQTGRALEQDLANIAKFAGIFVASGVRASVDDIDQSLELDLVVRDPKTNQLVIVENKTISGYWPNKEVITCGKPKKDNVLQDLIYHNEFTYGWLLKEKILQCKARREELKALVDEYEANGQPIPAGIAREFKLNRIEVDEENLALASDDKIGTILTYVSRDKDTTREFEIELYQAEDGNHYPKIDGIETRMFMVESVYERYEALKDRFNKNKQHVMAILAKAGIVEPDADARYSEIIAYRDRVFRHMRNLPPEFWPPAEYEWRYSEEKIEKLFQIGSLAKTKYEQWKTRAKARKPRPWPGDWQCKYCPYFKRCGVVEYPDMAHMIVDLSQVEEEEEEAA